MSGGNRVPIRCYEYVREILSFKTCIVTAQNEVSSLYETGCCHISIAFCDIVVMPLLSP